MQIAPFVESVQQGPRRARSRRRFAGGRGRPADRRRARVVPPSQTARGGHRGGPRANGAASGRHVEVRLAGQDPSLVFVEDTTAPGPSVGAEDAFSARITLRLPEALKASIEFAASREGASVNAWIVQILARSIDPRPQRGPKRLTGFARS